MMTTNIFDIASNYTEMILYVPNLLDLSLYDENVETVDGKLHF
jgi:hypothetical protein